MGCRGDALQAEKQSGTTTTRTYFLYDGDLPATYNVYGRKGQRHGVQYIRLLRAAAPGDGADGYAGEAERTGITTGALPQVNPSTMRKLSERTS